MTINLALQPAVALIAGLALAIVIERFISLKVAKVAPPRLLEEVLSVTRTSLPAPDVVTQLEKNSALGEVLASGLRAVNSNPHCSDDDLRATMEGAGRVVTQRLEHYLAALATIASSSPVLSISRRCRMSAAFCPGLPTSAAKSLTAAENRP